MEKTPFAAPVDTSNSDHEDPFQCSILSRGPTAQILSALEPHTAFSFGLEDSAINQLGPKGPIGSLLSSSHPVKFASASSTLEVRIMQKAANVGNCLKTKEVSDAEKVYHPVVG
jgi:hypothetical protein